MNRYFPAPQADPSAAAQSSAALDTQRIAGRYWSSRRVQSSFASVFYVLQQVAITDNGDGTIGVPNSPTNETRPYREVGPQVWHEVDGSHGVSLLEKNNSKVIALSEDPSSALQPVPAWRSGSLNLPLLLGTTVVLLWAAIAWPIAAVPARLRGPGPTTHDVTHWRRLTRVACVVALAYLAGRAGLWNAWRTVTSSQRWSRKVSEGAIAVALPGIVWLSFVFKFASVDVNY